MKYCSHIEVVLSTVTTMVPQGTGNGVNDLLFDYSDEDDASISGASHGSDPHQRLIGVTQGDPSRLILSSTVAQR